jgi:hypothetical protein
VFKLALIIATYFAFLLPGIFLLCMTGKSADCRLHPEPILIIVGMLLYLSFILIKGIFSVTSVFLFVMVYKFIWFDGDIIYCVTFTKATCYMNEPLKILLGIAFLHSIGAMIYKHYKIRNQPVPQPLHPPFTERSTLVSSGPPIFTKAVDTIMKQLLSRAPQRFEEVLLYLPQATYNPNSCDGNTNGVFGLSGEDLPALRFMLLHQVGHNMNGKSELLANRYAREVLKELGEKDSKGRVSCEFVDNFDLWQAFNQKALTAPE